MKPRSAPTKARASESKQSVLFRSARPRVSWPLAAPAKDLQAHEAVPASSRTSRTHIESTDGIMQDPSSISGGEDAGFVAWLEALSENSSLPDQVGLALSGASRIPCSWRSRCRNRSCNHEILAPPHTHHDVYLRLHGGTWVAGVSKQDMRPAPPVLRSSNPHARLCLKGTL